MRKVLMVAAIAVLGLAVAMNASAFTREAVRMDAGAAPYALSADCTLDAHNICAGWIWTFNVAGGEVWGAVLDANNCSGGCLNGGAVTEITLYSRCATVPGSFGGLGLTAVDATGCPTGIPYYASGPLTVTHCVSGDRWTVFPVVPSAHTLGRPFAVTLTWGAEMHNPDFATDNGIANLFCSQGVTGLFPGCSGSTLTCSGWTIPPQNSFIYIADINADTVPDDICAIYGSPSPLSFPYLYPYGYLPNNLILSVGFDCSSPTAVENSTWGHVKALYE